jgi:hypothetical protein
MKDDQPRGPLKVPVEKAKQRIGPPDTEQEAKAQAAALAEARLQRAAGAVKDAFRNSRHS